MGVNAKGLAAVLVLVLVAVVPNFGTFTTDEPSLPNSDSLFYQSQSLDLRTDLGPRAAREQTFASELGRRRLEEIRGSDASKLYARTDWRDWVAHHYQRRWLVPAATAVVEPSLGDRAFNVVGLIGCILIGPLLFALLRMRFSFAVSFGLALACMLWPPMLDNAEAGIDTWGVVFAIVALMCGVAVLERGLRWLPLWIASMLALAFTHDATVIPLAGALLALFFMRERRSLALVVSGVAAAIPATVIFPADLKEYLSWVLSAYDVPEEESWSFIIREEPHQIAHYLKAELWVYPNSLPVPVTILFWLSLIAIAAGLLYLLVRGGRDPYMALHRGAVVGVLAYLAVGNGPTNHRLVLLALPIACVGIAAGLSRMKLRAPGYSAPTRRPGEAT